MDLPYTKEEVVKNDFLFVSYKHEDTEIVVEVIGFLVEQGIRIWYDADLVYGDKWPEIAEKLIKNDHCRGVIFLIVRIHFKAIPFIWKEDLR